MRTTIGKAGFKEYVEQMLSWLLGGSVSLQRNNPQWKGCFQGEVWESEVNVSPWSTLRGLPEEVTFVKTWTVIQPSSFSTKH